MAKNDDVKKGVNLTPPILGGLLGVKSTHTASKDGKTGYGPTAKAAKADLEKKSKK